MNRTQEKYKELLNLSRHITVLKGISSHLHWDEETYLPPAAAEIRAEQLKVLAGVIHEEATGKKYAKVLSSLIDLKKGVILEKELTNRQKSALKEWQRDYIKETTLPKSFVEDFAQLSSQAIQAWRMARKDNAFQRFAPFLDRIIQMNRKKADLLGFKEHPYDALIDLYEHDTSAKEIEGLFNKLKKRLIPLLSKIAKAKQVGDDFLFGSFSQEKQLKFGKILLNAMGYEMEKGRLDLSTHPFSSSSHPTDSRITTRIHANSIMSNILVILHEGGHSLYEMGLPVEDYGSPLCEAISLGMHESQSRWWETRIGLTKPFWQYFLPILRKNFPKKFDSVDLDIFYRAINKVEPSFIRVEADEVTYPLHVILRFEIEKALIEGSMKVREIPEVWNSKMKEYLGIIPPNNTEGCLQDIHWSMGAFGYFPTYSLGNMYTAQMFTAFSKKFPDWQKKVASGNFLFIKQWLHEEVYQYGRQYSSKELIEKITGKQFSEKEYIHYLEDKYTDIYTL